MRVDAAKGHPENSPTKAELEKSFLLSKEYMPSETANRVKDRILMFEQEQNVEDLVRLAYKGIVGNAVCELKSYVSFKQKALCNRQYKYYSREELSLKITK